MDPLEEAWKIEIEMFEADRIVDEEARRIEADNRHIRENMKAAFAAIVQRGEDPKVTP